MHKASRKAIADLLPVHAYDATPLSDDIDATWTTKERHFSLKTSPMPHKEWGNVGDARIEITNHAGEFVVLKTRIDAIGAVARVREAMLLLGCAPEDGR